MNLDILLEGLGIKSNFGDIEVTSVTERMENVKKGSLFVAVEGTNYDGNSFIEEAFSKGAVAVVTEKDIDCDGIIRVSDVRTALSFLCSAYYCHPQDKMKMIGITGTNGKTTTAEYLRRILTFAGEKCAVVGTLGISFDGYTEKTGFTTPSSEILFSELDKLYRLGTKYCIMEVSSQALSQKRVAPIVFDVSLVTNIGSDHLDYHGNVEDYVSAKVSLCELSEKFIVNADDAYSECFERAMNGKALSYSLKGNFADHMAKNLRYTDGGLSYLYVNENSVFRFSCNAMGEIFAYNTLAALTLADVLGISPETSAKALCVLPDIKGRMQKIENVEKNVYIDFAHTPEALYSVLSSLRDSTKGRLICVFGCGGDRDKSKRAVMGETSSLLADTVIITSDNPRNEKPSDIIADILKGVLKKCEIFVEPDREKAVMLALSKARTDDTVLIAGKGHEEYQTVGNEQKYFSDEITVKKILGVL